VNSLGTVLPTLTEESIKMAKFFVWDLDDTMWTGTISAGDDVVLKNGIVDLIRTLDERRILQSIASKNNHDDYLGQAGGIRHRRVLPSLVNQLELQSLVHHADSEQAEHRFRHYRVRRRLGVRAGRGALLAPRRRDRRCLRLPRPGHGTASVVRGHHRVDHRAAVDVLSYPLQGCWHRTLHPPHAAGRRTLRAIPPDQP